MAGYKPPNFNERAAASRAARDKALEQLRNKAEPDPEVLAERLAKSAAREAAAADKRAARQAAIEQARAARLASKAAEPAPGKAPAPAEAPAKPKRTEAELKAARDERYAARKARKK